MIPLRDDQPTFSTPFVNYFLIALNVLVFLWELSVGHRALNSFMMEFGVVPHHTLAVLSGHVSGGLGAAVEDYLGHFTYLVFYLMSGVAAGITHILVNQTSRVPSVGASGAIAGVMGAYFILYPKARVLVWFPPIFLFHVPAWLMLGYWFLMNFVSGASTAIAETHQTSGGIAFWAHIGGFVAGVIMINIFRERPQRYRYGTW